MQMNHDRPLSDFEEQIDIIKTNGFNPIAVTQMFMEDTFVFKTEDEAQKAYRLLERDENEKWIGKVVGWWYGKRRFSATVHDYEKEMDFKVLIYWL